MSTLENPNSATDPELSSNSSKQAAQHFNTPFIARSSDLSLSKDHEEDSLLNSIKDGSEEDPTYIPTHSPRDKGKNKAREQHRGNSTESSESSQDSSNGHVYGDRPNRFYGAPSTWYTWTHGEREIAESLATERARDLSVHLFNAFALNSRARHYRMNAVSGKVTTGPNESEGFKPPKVWTAWPLPPEEVPREPAKPIWDSADATSFHEQQDLRPSAELEEMIIATTLRFAKDKLNSRETASEDPEAVPTAHEPQLSLNGSTDLTTTPGPSEVTGNTSSAAGSEVDQGFDPNDMYTSQPYESNETIAEQRKSVEESDSAGDMSPTFLTDDEDARLVLRPIARHVLSKMDDLLTGLHTVRASYAKQRPKRRFNSLSGEDTDAAHAWSSSRSMKRKRARLPNGNADSEFSEGASTSQSKRTKNMRSSHRTPADAKIARLALRDWSEVIGTASLTDWDPDVVARASGRCAAVFGEDMQFRTFFEGERVGRKAAEASSVEHTASGRKPARHSEDPLQPAGWITEAETDVGDTTDVDSEDEEPEILCCPVRDCEQHDHAFTSWLSLQQHMKESHSIKKYGKRKTAKTPRPPVAETADTEAEAYTTEGERRYPCPVSSCSRAQKPFNRRNNLYNHLRKIHQDFDVQTFKKLQRKDVGERRGKWNDERRRHSRPRSTTPFPGEANQMELDD